jgi:hypothetical protein
LKLSAQCYHYIFELVAALSYLIHLSIILCYKMTTYKT